MPPETVVTDAVPELPLQAELTLVVLRLKVVALITAVIELSLQPAASVTVSEYVPGPTFDII